MEAEVPALVIYGRNSVVVGAVTISAGLAALAETPAREEKEALEASLFT